MANVDRQTDNLCNVAPSAPDQRAILSVSRVACSLQLLPLRYLLACLVYLAYSCAPGCGGLVSHMTFKYLRQ
jgi:hypothetical protein